MDETNIKWNEIDTIVISGVVSTEHYKGVENSRKYQFVKELVEMSDVYKIKIEDIKLCEIYDGVIVEEEEFQDFYFFDYNYAMGKKINYKRKTICDQRGKYKLCKHCNSIMDNYYIVCIENGQWKRVLE